MTNPRYRWLVAYLQNNRYDVQLVPITWNYRTVTQNAEEFLNFYNKNKSTENYILGFSYGAAIALMTANQTRPEKIILCSLSPDFKEDTKAMPKWFKNLIGKNRYADSKTRSARKIAKSVDTKLAILYGEKEGNEYPQLKKRSEETARLAAHSQLIVVGNAPHDISFPSYQAAIKKVV